MQLARDILEKSVETFTNPFYSILLALCPWLADARQLKANIKLTRQVCYAVLQYIMPCHAVPCCAVLCRAVPCCEVLWYPVEKTSSDILAIISHRLTLCAMTAIVLAMKRLAVSPQRQASAVGMTHI